MTVKDGRRPLERKDGRNGTRGERILLEKEVETRWMILKEGRRKNREKGRRRKEGGDGTRGDRIPWEKEVETRWMRMTVKE